MKFITKSHESCSNCDMLLDRTFWSQFFFCSVVNAVTQIFNISWSKVKPWVCMTKFINLLPKISTPWRTQERWKRGMGATLQKVPIKYCVFGKGLCITGGGQGEKFLADGRILTFFSQNSGNHFWLNPSTNCSRLSKNIHAFD